MRRIKLSVMKVVSMAALMVVALVVTATSAFASSSYVTVNDGSVQYESMDAAVAATAADSSGVITYHVHGSVTLTGDTDIALNGAATTVNIVGDGASSTSLTLMGSNNAARLIAKNATLKISDVKLADSRATSPAWEYFYLMFTCPTASFTNVVFDEGALIDGGTVADFTGCTFSSTINDGHNDSGTSASQQHYELWANDKATVNVNGCTFEADSYGAIKSTHGYYNHTDPYVALSVKNSTFTNIGTHRIIHLDAADKVEVSGNVATDCYNVTGDQRFIDIKPTSSSTITLSQSGVDDVDAINADYFDTNSMNNVNQYTLTLSNSETDKTYTGLYYQFNEPMTSYAKDGHTYGLISGYDVWTSADITGLDATQISRVSAGPRAYHLVLNYTVAFDKGAADATGAMDSLPMTYGVPETLTTCAFARDGYTFIGWATAADALSVEYADGAVVSSLSNDNGATVTLYALWKADNYTVAFDKGAADATGTMDSLPMTYGSSTSIAKCAFTRDGYTFAGWNTSADGTGTAYADGATILNIAEGDSRSVTLYAQWTKNEVPTTTTTTTTTTKVATKKLGLPSTGDGTSALVMAGVVLAGATLVFSARRLNKNV